MYSVELLEIFSPDLKVYNFHKSGPQKYSAPVAFNRNIVGLSQKPLGSEGVRVELLPLSARERVISQSILGVVFLK